MLPKRSVRGENTSPHEQTSSRQSKCFQTETLKVQCVDRLEILRVNGTYRPRSEKVTLKCWATFSVAILRVLHETMRLCLFYILEQKVEAEEKIFLGILPRGLATVLPDAADTSVIEPKCIRDGISNEKQQSQ